MLVIYTDSDEPVRFDIEDADGVAADLDTVTATLLIEDVGEYAIEATATAGVGLATVNTPEQGIFRYQVLVDGVMAEEGQCVLRPTISDVSAVS